MDTRKLQHYLAVLQSGSFYRAAKEVHLTQPALTRSIQALEHDLGVPLLDRRSGTVTATPYGELVREEAMRVVGEEREIRKKIEVLRKGHSGHISIGFSGSAASVLVKSYLRAGCVGNSQVKVRVQIAATQELIPLLEAGSLDAVIADLRSIDKTENFDIEKLPDVRIGLVCRGDHPILKREPLDLRQVKNFPLVSYSLSKAASRRLQTMIGYRGDPASLLTVELDNVEVLKEIVLTSNAVMLAPLAPLLAETQTGRLRMLPGPIMFTRYGLVKSAARLPHPALETLAQHARDHLEAIAM
jgi:DNA-binding transcriptional LysR family regulator